jgi:hypothetical protein
VAMVAAHFAGDVGEFPFPFLSVSVSFRIRVTVQWGIRDELGLGILKTFPFLPKSSNL